MVSRRRGTLSRPTSFTCHGPAGNLLLSHRGIPPSFDSTRARFGLLFSTPGRQTTCRRSLEDLFYFKMKSVSRDRQPVPVFYSMVGYQGLWSDRQRTRGRTSMLLEPRVSVSPSGLVRGHMRSEWRSKNVSGYFIKYI